MNRRVSIILPYYNRKMLLEETLNSFQHFYCDNPQLEIVVVDDCSDEESRIEELIKQYELDIHLIRIQQRTGVNPCYSYNVGVRQSTGDIIVLSSPEIFHTENMFEISDDFEKLSDKVYFQFSVFCLVKRMIVFDKRVFVENMGRAGYSYANEYGSWYTHSRYRPSCLNFFSALTRDNYYKLSGFDERFRHGTGYDDEEFKLRVLELVDSIIWFDEAVAVHVNHEIVNNLPPTTNFSVFQRTRKNLYKFNDEWGKL